MRDFLTYDLEWRKGDPVHSRGFGGMVWRPQVTCAGVFDGDRYRAYKSIEAFLRGELTAENSGRSFYAHAGGLADILFLLEYFFDHPEYEVKGAFSGSSMIIAHVTRGRHSWIFLDSFWLIRASLANIAKTIGMEKGEVSFDNFESFEQLREYNEQDCRILYYAIKRFEASILNLGGELRATLAATAMDLFRRKFLTRDIPTCENINQSVELGYYASRVEPFRLECRDAYYYDINSSFPFAMTLPCPGRYTGGARTLSDTRFQADGKEIVFAEVDVTVPESMLPPLPKRHEHGIFFPVGSWRGWYSDLDLQLLREQGGDVTRVHKVYRFEPTGDLRAYAETLYEMRRKSSDEADRNTLKLLLNGLYGKFSERLEKDELLVHPEKTPPREFMLCPGAWIVPKETKVPHRHVPISAYITSRARRTLFDHMQAAGTAYYCDTDGFATDRKDVPTSDKLGGLKLEKEIKRGRFVRPKVYEIDGIAKAKGFSLKPDRSETEHLPKNEREAKEQEESYARFSRLLNGEAIPMRRFARVKEVLSRVGKDDGFHPTERIIEKRLGYSARPKRALLSNGIDTRAWNVSELEAPWKGKAR